MNNCLKHIFKNSKKKCKYDDLQLMTTQPTNILVRSDRGRTRNCCGKPSSPPWTFSIMRKFLSKTV